MWCRTPWFRVVIVFLSRSVPFVRGQLFFCGNSLLAFALFLVPGRVFARKICDLRPFSAGRDDASPIAQKFSESG